MAEKALEDEKPEVREAAATALGQMEARGSVAKLIAALDDKEPAVVLAAAQALVHFGNERGYDIYYEVLTGQRRSGKGPIATEIDTLRNPKKAAELGFEEAIGFVPFGGMGLETLKVLRGGNANVVRAAAAKILASDPDSAAETALSDAAGDNNWQVRVAAIAAIARRGNPKLLSPVVGAMEDDKDAVKYSAAAAVVRLTRKRHGRLRLPKPD
jgi:HEAT repeat protein